MGELGNQLMVIRQGIDIFKLRWIENLTQRLDGDNVVRVVIEVMVQRTGMTRDDGRNTAYALTRQQRIKGAHHISLRNVVAKWNNRRPFPRTFGTRHQVVIRVHGDDFLH